MSKADRVGLDLGTTNSTCCYYNKERKVFECLKFDNQVRDFFPTMIAYRKGDDKIRYIGEMAKQYQLSEKYDVYEHFKLSMGREANEKNGRLKSPMEAARDFIEEVLIKFREQVGDSIDSIVMTVPDIWKNEEENKIAVDHLTEIYQQLNFEVEKQVTFESEPVSAAAYYCRELCKGEYSGYVVVVDYGGGTLDLTLCRVDEDERIVVLRRCGDGGSVGQGCAGAAFDVAMTQRIVEQNHLDQNRYAVGTKLFNVLKDAFENAKISSTKVAGNALRRYYKTYDASAGISYDDSEAFTVTGVGLEDEYDVKASDLAMVFEQVNAKVLRDALHTMKGYCEEFSVDTNSQKNFRVLMVGGFSNFYCVESMVREVFDSIDGMEDLRFDKNMRIGERTTAVSHGAAVIAGGIVPVVHLCPSDVGFYYFDVFTKQRQEKILIERDRPITDYREPKYFEGVLKAGLFGKNSPLHLFFDDGNGRISVAMDVSLLELCPNAQAPDNIFQIGFSMGKNQIPMLHIKDKAGEIRTESLHKVLEKISLVLVGKEKGVG